MRFRTRCATCLIASVSIEPAPRTDGPADRWPASPGFIAAPQEKYCNGDRCAEPKPSAFLLCDRATERDAARQDEDPPVEKSPFIAQTHAIPVTVDEFGLAQRNYPIVFSIGDNPIPIALMGLNEGVNVFLDPDGRPIDSTVYIPAYIRRYPFLLARLNQESDELSCASTRRRKRSANGMTVRPCSTATSRATRPRRSSNSASNSRPPASGPQRSWKI